MPIQSGESFTTSLWREERRRAASARRKILIGLLGWGLVGAEVGSQQDGVAPPVVTDEDRALAARAEAIVDAPDPLNPGREAANYLKYEWARSLIPILSGREPAEAKRLLEARRLVADLVSTAEKGRHWPPPPVLKVPFRESSPAVDGVITENEWTPSLALNSVFPFNSSNAVAAPATVWRITWNRRALFFAFECADADIQAPDLPRDGEVFKADCVEIFLLPEYRTGVYWEIVVGATGCLFDALHAKKFQGWGAVSRVDLSIEGMETAARADGTPNDATDHDAGFRIEVAIPWKEIPSYSRGNLPRAGDVLRLMLVRLDQNAGEPLKPYAFQPLLSWGHNIWSHVPIVLGE